ncbi:hypothetical protein JL09_g4143 [Pichia kudriavzevii]|uniref:Zn(2)-C6 fungal-type domain-containing protein n=1 Tax=Pichia kudriavzevii TaxID=4909 RepID=A0A099NV39_PICKU|nr:hypothetical protein JL09_g4143 [Pichia kudriavzevii]
MSSEEHSSCLNDSIEDSKQTSSVKKPCSSHHPSTNTKKSNFLEKILTDDKATSPNGNADEDSQCNSNNSILSNSACNVDHSHDLHICKKKKRARRSYNCGPCKKHKIKCDMEIPCGNCKKYNRVDACLKNPPNPPSKELNAIREERKRKYLEKKMLAKQMNKKLPPGNANNPDNIVPLPLPIISHEPVHVLNPNVYASSNCYVNTEPVPSLERSSTNRSSSSTISNMAPTYPVIYVNQPPLPRQQPLQLSQQQSLQLSQQQSLQLPQQQQTIYQHPYGPFLGSLQTQHTLQQQAAQTLPPPHVPHSLPLDYHYQYYRHPSIRPLPNQTFIQPQFQSLKLSVPQQHPPLFANTLPPPMVVKSPSNDDLQSPPTRVYRAQGNEESVSKNQ